MWTGTWPCGHALAAKVRTRSVFVDIRRQRFQFTLEHAHRVVTPPYRGTNISPCGSGHEGGPYVEAPAVFGPSSFPCHWSWGPSSDGSRGIHPVRLRRRSIAAPTIHNS